MEPKITAEELLPLHGRIGISTMIPDHVGLIAVSDIPANTIIGHTSVELTEYLCPWEEYENLDQGTRDWVDDFCLGTPAGFYTIGNPNHWPIVWHMNHSCDGNVGFDFMDNFISLKKIRKGEEIVYDYALAESGPKFNMSCKCGSANCRGIITGSDWKKLGKNPEIRKNMISYLKDSC